MSTQPLTPELLNAQRLTWDDESWSSTMAALKELQATRDDRDTWRTEALTAKAERDTLRRTVETLQGVTTALAEEAKNLNGEVLMLRSALEEKTREHRHLQDLLTKCESERDEARAELKLTPLFSDAEAVRQAHESRLEERGLRMQAESERDAAREQLAASEAARERLAEVLDSQVVHHIGQAERFGGGTVGVCDLCAGRDCHKNDCVLSASPSAVLVEREAGLKARIAQFQASEADWEKKARECAVTQNAAMAKAAMLREALEACGYWLHPAGFNAERQRLFDRTTESVANSHSLWNYIRVVLGNAEREVDAWLSERLKQEREAERAAIKAEAVAQIEASGVQAFTTPALAEHDAKVRAAALESCGCGKCKEALREART